MTVVVRRVWGRTSILERGGQFSYRDDLGQDEIASRIDIHTHATITSNPD